MTLSDTTRFAFCDSDVILAHGKLRTREFRRRRCFQDHAACQLLRPQVAQQLQCTIQEVRLFTDEEVLAFVQSL